MERLWLILVICLAPGWALADPLPSWNGTEARSSIIAFVEAVTDPGPGDAPPSAVRLATKSSSASATPASTGGGSNSASLRFQMACARSVAVFEPASLHWPKFDQSETSGS